jgi:cbb3-type cytochrome oxidase subunit 3
MKSGEIVSACLIALFLSLIAVNTFLLDKVNKTAETIKG